MGQQDRKSTRLNSSHEWISYAVFCLKKKKKNKQPRRHASQETQGTPCRRPRIRLSSHPLRGSIVRPHLFSALCLFYCFFFFNDTATTEIYTLSLHDALPISRLNSSHGSISYAVFWSSDVRSEEHTSELRHGSISYAVFCFKNKQTSIR